MNVICNYKNYVIMAVDNTLIVYEIDELKKTMETPSDSPKKGSYTTINQFIQSATTAYTTKELILEVITENDKLLIRTENHVLLCDMNKLISNSDDYIIKYIDNHDIIKANFFNKGIYVFGKNGITLTNINDYTNRNLDFKIIDCAFLDDRFIIINEDYDVMQYVMKTNEITKIDSDFNIKTLINEDNEMLDFMSLDKDAVHITKIYSKIIFNNILSTIIYTPSLNGDLQSLL